MENVNLSSGDLKASPISTDTFNNFIINLPKIGGGLKSLHLGWDHLPSDPNFQFELIKLIVDNCPNLEEFSLGNTSADSNDDNFCHNLCAEAMNYLCENLTQKIVKLEVDEEKNFDNACLKKAAMRFTNLRPLNLSSTRITFDDLIENIEELSSLEYLHLPDQVAKEVGVGYRYYDVNVSKMRKLSAMKNLKNLIGNGFDFGDPESATRRRSCKHGPADSCTNRF